MFNSYLTRTSIEESKNIVQLMSSSFYPKAVEKDIISDKPFLIICHNEVLSVNEMSLLNKGTKLSSNESYSIYEISKNKIFYNTTNNEVEAYSNLNNSLIARHGFLVSDSTFYFSYLNYNELSSPEFCETGCYQNVQSGYSKLLEVKGTDLIQGQTYSARFWMYNGGENRGQDAFNGMAFFENDENGKKEWIFPITSMQNTQEINGDWNLVEVVLSDVDTTTNYHLLLKGDDRAKMNYYIDDVIFYDQRLTIYKEFETYLFKNGHRISMPK